MRALKRIIRSSLGHVSFSVPIRNRSRLVRVPIIRGEGLGVLNAFLRRRYQWMSDLLEKLPVDQGSLFVDVGAHLGETLITMKCLHRAWPYLGFEPNPFCVSYMEELIRINAYPGCRLMPTGLSEEAGEATLFLESPTDSGGTIVRNLRPERTLSETIVPTLVFDEVRSKLASGTIGVIKMDVEGGESKVLSGMRRTLASDRPVVLCEVLWTDAKGDVRMTSDRNARTLAVLEDAGYSVYQILKKGGKRTPALRRITAFAPEVWSPENSHLCDYLFVPGEMSVDRLESSRP